MKKIIFSISLFAFCYKSHAQLTSLNENFNAGCPINAAAPNGWIIYNPLWNTIPDGEWKCHATEGRAGTRGVTCSGLFVMPPSPSATYHTDTAFLISPKLNLNSYANVYLNFDTKTTNFNLGAKFDIFVSGDSSMGYDTSSTVDDTVFNKTSALMPLISSSDETDWVTHQVDLTPYKHNVPLYIGFRYVSATGTNGSRWYLDNIHTTTVPLITKVVEMPTDIQKISLSSSASNGKMFVSYNTTESGNYTLALYDMTGREIYRESTYLKAGQNTYTVNGISMPQGIYLLRLGNSTASGAAKVYAW